MAAMMIVVIIAKAWHLHLCISPTDKVNVSDHRLLRWLGILTVRLGRFERAVVPEWKENEPTKEQI